ncbi:uncharacterized protein [Spinacia oleracea]|uniref:DDE Tnp4 domain-containing protein n=1 Tax=Spinacia oleracea TaxID=3562 RepID=A0ABM3QRR5_SPIOL|nr:uncharacterized protein LOC130461819 [Spinacia oleracea]
MNTVVENDNFMQQRRNAAGKLGLSGLQKCTASVRMLAYGLASDAVDEYVRIGQELQENHYCISLSRGDQAFRRGGRSGNASLILEAVEDQNLWIWHSFFGIPGSCNDFNILYRSPVVDLVLQGFTHPQLQKRKRFADRQAHVRKEVERAFGVLQARFAIIRQPSLAYDEDILTHIIKVCLIMHNMIVEDERDMYIRVDMLRRYYEQDLSSCSAMVNNGEPFEFQVVHLVNMNAYLGRRITMRNSQTHQSMKDDLIEHGSNNH